MAVGRGVPNTEHLELGASVAIDGVCLTAVAVHGTRSLSTSPRDHGLSTIGDRRQAMRSTSNVRSASVMKLVATLYLGTFDTGRIVDITRTGETGDLRIEASEATMRHVFEKGHRHLRHFIDGRRCEDDGFYLHLIPETLANHAWEGHCR